MKRMLFAITLLVMVAAVYAAPGDTLSSFTLPGTPSNAVRGVDKDFTDGDIWAGAPFGTSNIQFCKFDQDDHSIVQAWMTAQSMYWLFDLGFGYDSGGTKCLVMMDQNSPKVRLINPTTGASVGTLAEPYSGYCDGCGVDNVNYYMWSCSYNEAGLKKSDYPCTAWTTWATNPAFPVMGAAFGWGKVFFLTTSPDYKIYQYNAGTAALEQTITLTGWPSSRYVMGLSAGRENAVPVKGKMPAANETVFLAAFSGGAMIYEIEIGDVYLAPDDKVVPTSLGTVKSMYR